MTAQDALILAAALMALSVSASAKTGSTLYPPERVANARRNIERYEWAREIRDAAVKAAKTYADQSDDFLWDLVTPQSIPRGTQVNKVKGCPKCGRAIDKFGTSPWKVDVIKRPWKIECPSCGEVFPKNDFARFYESGKDERGVFRPERADRSLLFNSDHPDPTDPLHAYGVDDGLGWKTDKGDVYRLIGYYGHYGSWAATLSAMRNLRDAYLYTGDSTYARRAGVLLYRAAEFYPEMDWHPWRELGFDNSDGHTGRGKVYGCIWETGVADSLITTYDGIYPALDDAALLDYVSKKAGRPVDAASFRALVEKNIIREAHDAILKRQISGNEGMHQRTMAVAAVALDEPGTTDKWLEWIFAPDTPGDQTREGGNIKGVFETKIDEDGMGNEASPSYNGIWRRCFRVISEVFEQYPQYKGTRFTDFPKYRKMFETPTRLICCDKFTPNIGDCGKTGYPGVHNKLDDLVYAFRTFKDPIFAQMAVFLNGGKTAGIRGEILDPEPEGFAGEIETVVKAKGPYVPKTENLPSYGLAILRSGKSEAPAGEGEAPAEPGNQRALTLYYGSNTGHGHKDTLNIELFAFGLDLMPDLGYPEHASVWPSRYLWSSNTISHNTIIVDRKKQGNSRLGKARFVVEGKGASAAEVYCDAVYPQTSLYQRTIAMVDVSDQDFYLVDIFRVNGGSECHYSLHGLEGSAKTEGLNLVAQKKGTLAGEDVEFAANEPRDQWDTAGGFQYLYDIRRDTNPGPIPSVTWKVKDTWKLLDKPADIRLRFDLVNPPGDVILAHGDPPQNKPGNPRRLTYVICPDKGSEPVFRDLSGAQRNGNPETLASESTFVTVIEPYVGKRVVKSIERLGDSRTTVIKIDLSSGRTDYIISALDPTTLKIAGKHDFAGRFGVIREEKGMADTRLCVQ